MTAKFGLHDNVLGKSVSLVDNVLVFVCGLDSGYLTICKTLPLESKVP